MSSMTIQPIETIYRGRKYRSRTEARWAIVFESLGIPFQYEPEGYDLGSPLGYYLPDFLLNNGNENVFVEIKGAEPTHTERMKAHALADLTNTTTLILVGQPDYYRIMLENNHVGNCEVYCGFWPETPTSCTDLYDCFTSNIQPSAETICLNFDYWTGCGGKTISLRDYLLNQPGFQGSLPSLDMWNERLSRREYVKQLIGLDKACFFQKHRKMHPRWTFGISGCGKDRWFLPFVRNSGASLFSYGLLWEKSPIDWDDAALAYNAASSYRF